MHNVTKFHQDIILGSLDWETVRLAAPSWDCWRYWGFWYIQNINIHTHFDLFDKENNRNMFDSIKHRFTSWRLNEKDTWTFCELMVTFYSLEEIAAVYWRGWSNYGFNPLSEFIKNPDEVKRINDIILPAIFDEIWKLFNPEVPESK